MKLFLATAGTLLAMAGCAAIAASFLSPQLLPDILNFNLAATTIVGGVITISLAMIISRIDALTAAVKMPRRSSRRARSARPLPAARRRAAPATGQSPEAQPQRTGIARKWRRRDRHNDNQNFADVDVSDASIVARRQKNREQDMGLFKSVREKKDAAQPVEIPLSKSA